MPAPAHRATIDHSNGARIPRKLRQAGVILLCLQFMRSAAYFLTVAAFLLLRSIHDIFAIGDESD